MDKIRVISSEPDSFIEYFKKIWAFRSLIWVFARRDLKVKYSQTLLGISWTLLQPLLAVFIYSFFFGYILNWKSGELPFPVYVLSGLIGWNFFSYIIFQGSTSVQDASHTIKKIYFPKSILPLSKTLIALIELMLGILLFIPLLLYYRISISWHIVFIPIVILFNAICGLLPVFWIAALAYKRRDLFHLLPYLVTFGVWFTPIFFTTDILPQKLNYMLDFNPLANVIEIWRWLLFNYGHFKLIWVANFFLVLCFCIVGMSFYNKKESEFADYI
ncbi:MAG: ABC transporter permease [bacterium]|nr:ABC transporter permease [bacterium]